MSHHSIDRTFRRIYDIKHLAPLEPFLKPTCHIPPFIVLQKVCILKRGQPPPFCDRQGFYKSGLNGLPCAAFREAAAKASVRLQKCPRLPFHEFREAASDAPPFALAAMYFRSGGAGQRALGASFCCKAPQPLEVAVLDLTARIWPSTGLKNPLRRSGGLCCLPTASAPARCEAASSLQPFLSTPTERVSIAESPSRLCSFAASA